MKNCLIKLALVLVCLALLSVTLVGQRKGGGGGGGGSTACATVTTPQLSTSSASPGINVGVFSKIINCSTGKARYTVTVSAVSSCGEETVIASAIISFNGGEAKLFSTTYAIAPDTCRGVSSVFVNVYSRDTMLASQSVPVTIQ